MLDYFGAQVRQLRNARRLSQSDLGDLLFVHRDLIRKIERAERIPSREFVEGCDTVFGAGGALARPLPMIERERFLRRDRNTNDQTKRFRGEATDRPVLDWLLAPAGPRSRVRVADRDTTTAAAMLRQFRTTDHVQGAGSTYPVLADLLRRDFDVLADGDPNVASGFLELAGYEAVDLGLDGLGQQHYLRALRIMTQNGDRLYGGYLIAVSLAHLALHCGDPDQAIRLTTAALHGTATEATPAVRAAFRTVLARAHARRGDEAACAAALLQVDADLARSKPSEEPGWIAYFGEADLADEKAHCFFDLGLHELAQRQAVRAIALLTPDRARRLAIDTALHASALARAGQVDHASVVARRAIDHASGVRSFRSAHRVVLMMAELQPYADVAEVRDVVEYARANLPPAVTPA
ncbi:transcriptional regulator with XRE-family HTH domain [Catenuloplanes nepalensis]|uniref:Transcriptional regulator with XRE-family HTH domain n=1 Tax=Catenuloplanes nepalensis TaxID=587533 RepID=A0ABT9N5M2_9ACTN|nr:helix-turn-helix transcriptional regulator [Catenuloplanes nepalensis]MDP9799010.1 transcriptional regulator with XRE-family HTH domain [Catenuloplanes nepalensis]